MKEFEVNTNGKYTNSLIFRAETGCELYIRDTKYFVSGCNDQAEANDLIANHNPSKPAEPTVEEKLESVGLNLNDLKTALGL